MDTSLIFNVNRRAQHLDDVNNTMLKVHNWFTINNLVLNEIRFALPNVRSSACKVILNRDILDFVEKTVFLGTQSCSGVLT